MHDGHARELAVARCHGWTPAARSQPACLHCSENCTGYRPPPSLFCKSPSAAHLHACSFARYSDRLLAWPISCPPAAAAKRGGSGSAAASSAPGGGTPTSRGGCGRRGCRAQTPPVRREPQRSRAGAAASVGVCLLLGRGQRAGAPERASQPSLPAHALKDAWLGPGRYACARAGAAVWCTHARTPAPAACGALAARGQRGSVPGPLGRGSWAATPYPSVGSPG